MEYKLKRHIAKALRIRRNELRNQIGDITALLEELEPSDLPKLVYRSAAEQHEESALNLLTVNDWKTSQQVSKATGMTRTAATRALNRLVESGAVERQFYGRGLTIPHYRLKPQEMRLVAGVGELT